MKIKDEIKPFTELFAAIVLSFLIVLGFLHNFIKPIYDYRNRPLNERIGLSLNWYFRVISEIFNSLRYFTVKLGVFFFMLLSFRIWKSIKFIVHETARTLDLIGNVAAGEMIEDVITPFEKTYFGIGDITISAAIGYIVSKKKQGVDAAINKYGLFLDKVLKKSFNEEEHSYWSFQREIESHAIYGEDDFLDKWHETPRF